MMKKYILTLTSIIVFCAILYPQGVKIQNYDCEIYDTALMHIDKKWDSTPSLKNKLKLYYYIRKSKLTFEKAYLENCYFKSFKDPPLKWEELSFSSLENDSVNCNFCKNLNYEYHYEEDAPFLLEEIIKSDTTKYIPVEVKFSQMLYKNTQYALFLMLLRFNHVTALYKFLFERENEEWILKEQLIDTD